MSKISKRSFLLKVPVEEEEGQETGGGVSDSWV